MKKCIKLTIIALLIGISFSIVHSITPIYVKQLNLPDYYFGFFFMIMSLGQVIGALLWSLLANKVKKKYLIITGILGYAVFQALFGFVNQYPVLILVFRLFSGIFASAANTLIISLAVQLYGPENRIKYLSIMSAFSLLGSSLAYEIGGDLHSYANFSIPNIFITQICACIISALVTLLLLLNEEKEVTKTKINNKLNFKGLNTLAPAAFLLLIGLFILSTGQVITTKYIDVIVIAKGYKASDLGHFTLVCGVICCITNLFITPLLAKIKHIKPSILLVIITFIEALIVIVTFQFNKNNLLIMLYSVFMLFNVCKAAIVPLEQNYLIEMTPSEKHNNVIGLRQAFINLGSIIGPLIGASVYVNGNVLIFFVAAVLILFSAIIFFMTMLFKRRGENDAI